MKQKTPAARQSAAGAIDCVMHTLRVLLLHEFLAVNHVYAFLESVQAISGQSSV